MNSSSVCDFAPLMPHDGLRIVPFRAEHAAPFRDLNLAWIEKYFTVEERDARDLGDPATHIIAPGGYGYDPNYRSENSEYDVARAKALLDMYGYVDRNDDGWRELPDGKPLVIEYATEPDAADRQFDELWQKNMTAIGIRLRFKSAQWPEQLKAAQAGSLMVWQLGGTNASPDFQDSLQNLYGPAAGGQNLSRFKDPQFDALYRRLQSLPDGPERLALMRDALKIITAYMPQKYNVHRIVTWLMQPWLLGLRAPLYGNLFWQYVDIDDSKRPAKK